jgi:hypothetical protein
MSEMGSDDPFEYLKHKLWPKKGPRVKVPFDFQPLKVENRLNLLTCKLPPTYH